MNFGLIFILILYYFWPTFHPNAIDHGFWTNLNRNAIDHGFGRIFHPYAIDYRFWPYFNRNYAIDWILA